MKDSFVLWFTGLSGAGKTTLANKTKELLLSNNYKVEVLDGDVVRSIFPQIGFTRQERDEHIKRIGFLASILERNGIIVIASFISPYKESRNFVRKICKNFIEVYLSVSLEKCEERDVKGLYRKARLGDIKNFTGIDDPYDVPDNPELAIDTENKTIDESFLTLQNYLKNI